MNATILNECPIPLAGFFNLRLLCRSLISITGENSHKLKRYILLLQAGQNILFLLLFKFRQVIKSEAQPKMAMLLLFNDCCYVKI
jgi:hypothetical protein